MKHLKTYEGLFDFFKRKKEPIKKDFVITDDFYQIVSDILQDADLMDLEVHTQITGKNKIYSIIDRRVDSLNTARLSQYYYELKDFNLDDMCDTLSRLVYYVRSESENQLDVKIDFIENGPHSNGGYRLVNPSDELIYKQLELFYGSFAHDWKSIQISISNLSKRGTSDTGPR